MVKRVNLSPSPPARMIGAITADQQLVLIREYATGLDDYVLTFPKGVIDPGEDALAAANRELQEEAGFAAQKLTALREISAVPSYMTYKLQLVVAEQLYPSKLEGDEPEPLEVRLWPLDRLHELAEEPEFSEGRAIAALLLLQNYLKRPA